MYQSCVLICFLVGQMDTAKDDLGLGGKKASNGNWYGRKSGKHISSYGNEWYPDQPSSSAQCAFFNIHGYTSLTGILTGTSCGTTFDLTLCEIYYVPWTKSK